MSFLLNLVKLFEEKNLETLEKLLEAAKLFKYHYVF